MLTIGSANLATASSHWGQSGFGLAVPFFSSSLNPNVNPNVNTNVNTNVKT